jgi:hypothetical protein
VDKKSYALVGKNERDDFVKQVLAQEVHFHIPERDTPFTKAVMKQWQGILWCRVWWKAKKVSECMFHYPWVAKIPTKAGRVLAWRNGGDRGDYNFLIYVEATKEFHPRPNVKDVVELIEMIDSPEDAVLFVGRPLGKKNKAYFERILK